MSKKADENKNETNNVVKKSSRKKKDAVVETVAEPVAASDVSSAEPAAEAPVKKRRGRKPKTADAPAAAAETPAKPKRVRKPKNEAAEAPAPKKRGRRKAAEMTAEPAPAVAAATAFADSEPVELNPNMVVEIEDPAEKSAAPAKKPRKPRAKKAETPEAPAEPKKRGRKPKDNGPELKTILQIGEAEFDITDIALKAYKEYKRVHKRKVVSDFRIYVKPEENAAYFTVNGEGAEEFKVELS